MKPGLLSAIFLMLVIGCNQAGKKDDDTVRQSPPDTAFQGLVDTAMAGIYQAILPCTDCNNRMHTVMLNADGSYRLEEEHMGKGVPPAKSKGQWLRNKNTVTLMENNKNYISYTLQNDTLKVAETSGEKKDTVFFDLLEMPSNKFTAWQEQWKSGIDFFGVGTEPFWSIAVDRENMLTLTFADRKLPVKIKTPKPFNMGDSLVYEGNDAKGKLLRVTIYANFCNDGMSDFIYEQSVRISYQGMLLQGCGHFKE